ncbi:MAG: hypothetical protein IIB64_09190 [Proteobacteria bacterium]|nr:hypothetical protein [Pseudomonadota bacterium]
MSIGFYQTIIILGYVLVSWGFVLFINKVFSSRIPEEYNENEPYLVKLIKGNINLAETFWLWGFLGFIIYGTVVFFASQLSVATEFVLVLMLSYLVFASTVIWNSARTYKGKKQFAIAAQTAVVFVWLKQVFGVLVVNIFS